MAIILKENDWAQEMLESETLGRKPSETMKRIARYYLDTGLPPSQVKTKLEDFLRRCDPYVSLPKWDGMLDRALASAKKHPAINIESIDITDIEMKKVDALPGAQTKRLAFTLLALSKYWNIANPKCDSWVINNDSEVMAMANINTSTRRRCAMLRNLSELGLIQLSKKVDSTSIRVLFANEGEVVMKITDFRNLGYQYLMHHGEPYFPCSHCGLTVKIDNPGVGRKQRYCHTCAQAIAVQQRVNSAMRLRAKAGNQRTDKPSSKSMYTVYMHESPEGRRYIGATDIPLSSRWKGGNGYKSNQALDGDISKYGWAQFRHFKLAEVEDNITANGIKNYYMSKFKTTSSDGGYNRAMHRNSVLPDPSIVEQHPIIEVNERGEMKHM